MEDKKAIEIPESVTATLMELWQEFTTANREAQARHMGFQEFIRYARKKHNVPENYQLSPDGKQFVAPPESVGSEGGHDLANQGVSVS